MNQASNTIPGRSRQPVVYLPAKPLRALISHYWISKGNLDPWYEVMPDGAVDMVIAFQGTESRHWIYGTTTRPALVPLTHQTHYVGIRFRPGQSRHFIDVPAIELTNTHLQVEGEPLFSLARLAADLQDGDTAIELDRGLMDHLARQPPRWGRIDECIALIESAKGNLCLDEMYRPFGRSRRQFERVFKQIVGISPKAFAAIRRFHYAVARIRQGGFLADCAAAAGYTDQSHMNHAFRRLSGGTPGRFADTNVVFLQDWVMDEQDDEPC